ncbi:MAG: GntR family transcriptional regulator [Gemmatimonadaceae bacterium]
MPVRKRAAVAAILRDRIERALGTGALVRGDRLPGTRETGLELSVDPRVFAAAYTDLADEGLVELRPRSGVYVARQTVESSGERRPPVKWLVDIFAEGVAQGFSTRDLCDHLREAALAPRVRFA